MSEVFLLECGLNASPRRGDQVQNFLSFPEAAAAGERWMREHHPVTDQFYWINPNSDRRRYYGMSEWNENGVFHQRCLTVIIRVTLSS